LQIRPGDPPLEHQSIRQLRMRYLKSLTWTVEVVDDGKHLDTGAS